MTEKRFKAHIFDDGVNERYYDGIIDNEDNDDAHVIVNYQYISNLLNKLYEENEELKQENQILSEQKYIYKQDWKHICIDKELLDNENQKLMDENKQLKQQNELLFRQIKAFRDDCITYGDSNSVNTINELLNILKNSKELFE